MENVVLSEDSTAHQRKLLSYADDEGLSKARRKMKIRALEKKIVTVAATLQDLALEVEKWKIEVGGDENGHLPPKGIPVENPQSRWLLPPEMFLSNSKLNTTMIQHHLQSNFFFVGVQEHMEHSECLLRHKLGQNSLPKECNCKFMKSSPKNNVHEHKHPIYYTADQVRIMGKLIKFDRILYAVAYLQFIKDLEEVEKKRNVELLSCLIPGMENENHVDDYICLPGEKC